MPVAGNVVLDSHIILKAADDLPLTGVTYPQNPGVALTLTRQSGDTMVAATEVISWAEIGATGTYYFTFTPLGTGLYMLHLRELGTGSGVGSGQRQTAFRYEILAAGAALAPAYTDAFCAETDIERWLQQAITSTTEPNDTEATAFAVGRAGVLMSLCARLGSAVTPATVTAGSRLQTLLREANAIGAAADYSVAQAFQRGTSISERTKQFLDLFAEYIGGPKPGTALAVAGLIEHEIRGNLASLATSHVLSGDTTARAAENAPQDIGLQIRMGDLF